ncbi:MAG: chemotaxis protein CheA [Paracoccaceae bacterium]|jgi:hypothetical protein
MVQNNKVLTVSYGTFSCTLEGFDDSFDTMKAIAEYFRDLASDDRYFGAEPPQPDADMLARIAQREASRQVEARHSDEGIVLRAAETAAPATRAIAPATAFVDEPAEEEAVIEEEITEAPATDDNESHVADAVEEAVVADVAEHQEVIEPEVLDVEFAEEVEAEIVQAPVAEEILEADSHRSETVPAADSIAAKLQRIREVVSRKTDEETTAEFNEDEHAEAFIAEAAEDITEVLNVADEAEAEYEEEDENEIDLESVLTRLEEPETEENETDVAEVTAVAQQEPNGLSGDDSIFGDFDDDDLDDDENEILNILNAAEEDDEDDIVSGAHEPDFDTPAESVTEEANAPVQVSRVKRAAVDAAIAAGTLEEFNADFEEEESSLSEADEADLARELAAVSDALDKSMSADDFHKDEFVADEGEAAAAEPFAEDAAEDAHFTDGADEIEGEQDVSRLMAEADAKLDEPEGSDNREVFTQLRAVVAAAEAEREAGGTVGTGNDPEPYMADLASVVRPRRPVSGQGRSSRPESPAKTAPLKLVAEQRIDTPTENTGPVRPRRIRAMEDETAGTTAKPTEGGFADYAADQGAEELPELFEAAAAYLSYVEVREQFSRPQLMNQIRQLELPGFTREDGLRAFGQMLRDGKIRKVRSGRFTASDNIGFQPDTRAVG